jgi:hypothetical protein
MSAVLGTASDLTDEQIISSVWLYKWKVPEAATLACLLTACFAGTFFTKGSILPGE